MPIRITKMADGFYRADILRMGAHLPIWSSNGVLTRADLIAVLRSQGQHQTDIGDAFYEADPNWLD